MPIPLQMGQSEGSRERRMLRKYRMIVELTGGMISDSDRLTYREARCLIECAQRSIESMSPLLAADFELSHLPALERMIKERFPFQASGELVN